MRTSLNEIKLMEDYLLGINNLPDQLLFEARLILNPELHEQACHQKQAYQVIEFYGRKKLKAEVEAVHQQLFSNPVHKSFAQRIMRLFARR